MGNLKYLVLILALMMFLGSSSSDMAIQSVDGNTNESVDVVETNSISYTLHSAITITSNSDFEIQGWPGYGNYTHPYIIENLEFFEEYPASITISDTTAYVIIRDCLMQGIPANSKGIELSNVTNLKIDSCIIGNHTIAIYTLSALNNFTLQNSVITTGGTGINIGGENITIIGNTFAGIGNGISISSNGNSIIANNQFRCNSAGLSIAGLECVVENNTFSRAGIILPTYSYEFHDMEFSNNTLNGKPIGYFYNISDTIITQEYSSLILVNCSNVAINNVAFTDVTLPIQLILCTQCEIINCSFVDGGLAFSLGDCFGIEVSNFTGNHITGPGQIVSSNNCTVSDSVFTDSASGFWVQESHGLNLTKNSIETTGQAMSSYSPIDCYNSDNIVIDNNILVSQDYDCILLKYSASATITNNTMIGGGISLEGNMGEMYHDLSDNTINGNELGYIVDQSDILIYGDDYEQLILVNCNQFEIQNLNVKGTSTGVFLVYCENGSIRNSNFSNCMIGIEILYSFNTSIEGCLFHENGYGVDIRDADNSSILYNSFIDCEHGFRIQTSDNCSIQANLLVGSLEYSFGMSYCKFGNVINNTVADSLEVGASFTVCSNTSITENQFINNGYDSLRLNTCYNATVESNNFFGEGDALDLFRGSEYYIVNNTFEGCSKAMNIVLLTDCYVNDNEINSCSYGVYSYDCSQLVIINNILNNDESGILFNDNSFSIIRNNSILYGYGRGITLESGCFNNSIYYNEVGGYFQGNARDYGFDNTWDDDIGQGNAWSDYIGPLTYSIVGSAGSEDRFPSLIIDDSPPLVNSPSDIVIELGDTDTYRIEWITADLNPDMYQILLDGIVIEESVWDYNVISETLYDLDRGTYRYSLVLYDIHGYTEIDAVDVEVRTTPGAIVIDSSSAFTSLGFPGDGSPSNPYRIENVELTLDGSCMYILDTDDYFVIRNCNLSSLVHSTGYGIFMRNAGRGIIESCNIISKEFGIFLDDVYDIEISGCLISSNSIAGIYIKDSELCIVSENDIVENAGSMMMPLNTFLGGIIVLQSQCAIERNRIVDNFYGGVVLATSSIPYSLEDNEFVGNGIVDYSSGQLTISGNKVNGKDVGYFVGMSHQTIDGSKYGQIILISCTDITIQGGTFVQSSIGVNIIYSTDCIINDCIIAENSNIGVNAISSDGLVINNSTIHSNGKGGIYVDNSVGIRILNNSVFSNGYYSVNSYGGIYIYYGCEGAVISGNRVYNNTAYGMIVTGNEETVVVKNVIGCNNTDGLHMYGSYLQVHDNKIGWNSELNAFSGGTQMLDDGMAIGNTYSDYIGVGDYRISGNAREADHFPSRFIDDIGPEIIGISDFSVELGSAESQLIWNVSDSNPATYTVYQNGTKVEHGAWSNLGVIFNISSTDPGVYNYTIVVYDVSLHATYDSVIVNIFDVTSPQWVEVPSAQQVEYGFPFAYQIEAADNHKIDHYWIDDLINFYVDENGLLTNATHLAIGLYELQVQAYDPSGYFCSSTFNISVQDTISPLINHPADIQYEVDTSGHYIIWSPTDLDPASYVILLDGSIIGNGMWNITGENIVVDLNGLVIGIYNYTVVVTDVSGNTISDTVIVTVTEPSTATTTTSTPTLPSEPTPEGQIPVLELVILSAGAFLFIILVIIVIRKKQ